MSTAAIDRVVSEIESAADEAVAFTRDLIRIPTVNPPGEAYEDCARLIGDRLARCQFDVEYFAADGRPEHTSRHPRINVVGTRLGRAARPMVHLNGHFDVVPAGDGWTRDPFGGAVEGGRIYGRGACDMKAGIAAALFALEAIRRAGVTLAGSVEISGTVDEESGGFAGVAWLAEHGRISASRTDYVIIPEPLYVDRICVGHRGVYWFEVLTRGRIAHGSMPFLGVSAIDHMGLRARSDPARAPASPRRPHHRGAGDPAGGAARDAEHQRHRRRPAGARHPDAVRRRHLPRGVRSPLPARGRVRRDQGGDRRRCWTRSPRTCRGCATS